MKDSRGNIPQHYAIVNPEVRFLLTPSFYPSTLEPQGLRNQADDSKAPSLRFLASRALGMRLVQQLHLIEDEAAAGKRDTVSKDNGTPGVSERICPICMSSADDCGEAPKFIRFITCTHSVCLDCAQHMLAPIGDVSTTQQGMTQAKKKGHPLCCPFCRTLVGGLRAEGDQAGVA